MILCESIDVYYGLAAVALPLSCLYSMAETRRMTILPCGGKIQALACATAGSRARPCRPPSTAACSVDFGGEIFPKIR